jgi:uncharacterized membrane protein
MTDLHHTRRALLAAIGAALCAACHYEGYNPKIPTLPTFTIQQLGVLSGGTQSEATGGSLTTIVGWGDVGGTRHAVTFAGGSAVRLPEPSGATTSEAFAVNASGVIVGAATTAGVRRGIVWPSATTAPVFLPTLGGAFSAARSINDQNIIAGVAQTDTGDTVIVLWQPGGTNYVVAPLDTGGGVDWQAVDVNNQLDVAGNLGPVATSAGAFYLNSAAGVNDTITPPANGTAVAHGMNNFGIVVGSVVATPTPPQAFVFTDNSGTVVLGAPPSGYTGISGNAITDGGIIAGTASTSDNAGNILTSVGAISSVTNTGGTFAALPSLGGTEAHPADNAVTPCGVILGRAAASGNTPSVAVAWIPKGCSIP